MDGPIDVDALAEALRVDGVVVDRVMGSGRAQETNDRIAALVREVPFPVYVALVEEPEGLPDDALAATDALAGLLNRRLGDGLYVLDTTEGIHQVYSFGLGADPDRLSLGASSNADKLDEAMQELGDYSIGTEDYVYPPAIAKAEAQVLAAEDLLDMGREPASGEYPATLTDGDAERLAAHALQVQAVAGWSPGSEDYVSVRTASGGLSALVGVLSGLVVALLLGQTLRGWPRYGSARAGEQRAKRAGRAAASPPPDLAVERARARDLLGTLSENLERVDWPSVRDRDAADRALAARDAAEPLLESDDVADVIGAQVLARAGSADLARGRRGRGEPVQTCFFDPRHPDGRARASWRLGDGEVEVPCCPACEADLAAGRTPDLLRLRSRGGTRPYWERDDVWARTGFGATSDFLAGDVLTQRAEER
ncbi:hypothetical protein GCM10023339_45710 [Alloalcanivorax gelatiniphagus]